MKKRICFILLLVLAIVAVPKTVFGQSSQVLIGTLQVIGANNISVQLSQGTTQIAVDGKTKMTGKGKPFLTLSDLQPSDLVAIVATDSAQTATATAVTKKAVKIFVKSATSSAALERHAAYGVVQTLNTKSNIIILQNPVISSQTFTLTINSQTVIDLPGTKNAKLTDISSGDSLVVVGQGQVSDQLFVTQWIHVIKTAKPSVTSQPATPSASVSVSPSQSVSPTTSSTSSGLTQ